MASRVCRRHTRDGVVRSGAATSETNLRWGSFVAPGRGNGGSSPNVGGCEGTWVRHAGGCSVSNLLGEGRGGEVRERGEGRGEREKERRPPVSGVGFGGVRRRTCGREGMKGGERGERRRVGTGFDF
ncbi:hypothetical protein TIFTF001_041899 [Ficus carica]|uniref:Uncharacterized protein n=1 Tax=Ficus carica TaxID=3494 RepID=A0AA87ZJZ6_FICCA|nr:hypothetical protein TIFTF001_041899 [Ficus carica]